MKRCDCPDCVHRRYRSDPNGCTLEELLSVVAEEIEGEFYMAAQMLRFARDRELENKENTGEQSLVAPPVAPDSSLLLADGRGL